MNAHTFLPGLMFGAIAVMLTPSRAADEPVKNLSAAEAIKLVRESRPSGDARASRPALAVLDVRTPAEFAAEHIEGAVNVDFKASDFEARLGALDKARPYLVHCARGNRSAKTRDLMKKLGFQNIRHLDGGLTAWKEAGGPVVAKK